MLITASDRSDGLTKSMMTDLLDFSHADSDRSTSHPDTQMTPATVKVGFKEAVPYLLRWVRDKKSAVVGCSLPAISLNFREEETKFLLSRT